VMRPCNPHNRSRTAALTMIGTHTVVIKTSRKSDPARMVTPSKAQHSNNRTMLAFEMKSFTPAPEPFWMPNERRLRPKQFPGLCHDN